MFEKVFFLCVFLSANLCIVLSLGNGGGRSMASYNYGGLANSNGLIGGVNSHARRGAGAYMGGYTNSEKDNGRKDAGAPSTPVAKSNRLSAWGIISIIMFIILICAGGYYGSICYPFFCKKERNYDIMNVSSTTTATPARSTEFGKLENYCSRSTTSSRSNDTGISNI